MLITKEWSEPRPILYGKNLLVRSSHANFNYKIFSAAGQSVEGTIRERAHTILVNDEFTRLVCIPLISFRANSNDELHVEFGRCEKKSRHITKRLLANDLLQSQFIKNEPAN